MQHASWTTAENKLDDKNTHLINDYNISICGNTCYVISSFSLRLATSLENNKLGHFFNFLVPSFEYIQAEEPKTEECLPLGDRMVLRAASTILQ